MQTKLKRMRKRKGFFARELASKAGVALRTYRYYEAGTRTPNVDTAKLLAKALGCTVEELF